MLQLTLSTKYFLCFGLSFLLFVNYDLLVFAHMQNCWPYNLVPFAIDPAFSAAQRQYILRQVITLNRQTCVYWADINDSLYLQNTSNYVHFVRNSRDKPCQSITRYLGGGDVFFVTISLGDHCFERAIVLHEMIHALGFDHEHQRIDRDCYVGVSESAKKSISYEIDTFFAIPEMDRFPYDKHSIMHYRRSGDLKALGERWYEWEPLGTEEERLTDLDVWKIEFRFCNRPHYCTIYPAHCEAMDADEAARNCTTTIPPS